MRALLPLAFAAALALPARALPPSLAWAAPGARTDAGVAVLVVERTATDAKLLSARAVAGPLKLKPSTASGGLVFAVRDRSGAPLMLGRTHDGELILHGDDLDPATGALQATTARLDKVAFLLRVPMHDGAADVALFEEAQALPGADGNALAEWVRSGDARLIPRGVLPLPVLPAPDP